MSLNSQTFMWKNYESYKIRLYSHMNDEGDAVEISIFVL